LDLALATLQATLPKKTAQKMTRPRTGRAKYVQVPNRALSRAFIEPSVEPQPVQKNDKAEEKESEKKYVQVPNRALSRALKEP